MKNTTANQKKQLQSEKEEFENFVRLFTWIASDPDYFAETYPDLYAIYEENVVMAFTSTHEWALNRILNGD